MANEVPLFRGGKSILRARFKDDGTVLLFKPLALKDEHVMKMTGAPGWDKRYVDQVFAPGLHGSLQYTYRNVVYSISIESFRDHAFVRDGGLYGEQYHCQVTHYATDGWKTRDLGLSVDNYRGSDTTPPQRLVFGEVAMCPKCKGRKQRKECDRCEGRGYIKNKGPIPYTAPDGL